MKVSLQDGRRLPPRDPRGGRPTRQVAEELGPHILEVAFAQFVAHGAEGASMSDIAAAAQVSKRTLYARFGSKAELLVAAVEHQIANDLRVLVDGIPAGTIRERLLHAAREMLDFSLTLEAIGLEALLIWIREHQLETGKMHVANAANAGVRVFESLLADLQDTVAAAPDQRRFLATFIFDALVSTPRHHILVRRDMENTEEVKTEFLERTMDLVTRAVPGLA